MDDSCAVCADALEWVAYGPCGHRDVCSTCVARLRVICGDRSCCICKTECPTVFVTKALGDFTRTISDFLIFPSEPKEGRVGSYWYNEDTEAFFDDSDHYKMIKAMCRLSCSVCDKLEEEASNGPKRRARFKNIEQLKGHLYHRHRLIMCSLCLEGRKVFIGEQKLYTRAQLNQHINTGDSEVDGDESERGGFTGHPICEFCKTPFYGDNELYSHMSTEHYTCHICQRQHPGQYEYYKNYDDLEIHFRREHFLCEDEACLAKKFVVFQSEAEMKRHNTLEHGGRMSRAKRSAALQIPTSFRYRRSNEQDSRRGRGRTFRRDQSDDQLSIAIQASLETANAEGNSREQSSSSSVQVPPDYGDPDIDLIIQPFEALAVTDSETSARYLQALGHGSRNAVLEESLFPPLPMAPSSSQQKAQHESTGLLSNSMAARLRRQSIRKANATSSGSTRSASASASAGHGHISSNSTHWPAIGPSSVNSRSSSTGANSVAASSSSTQPPDIQVVMPRHPSSSSWNLGNTSKVSHSAPSPILSESGSSTSSISDFPPVSATQVRNTQANSQVLPKVEDVHAANKSLVEKMRAALGNDEEKFAVFRAISGQYRKGSMDTVEYLNHVQQFGLLHLVMDLARLCPDAEKQKELVDAYNASLSINGLQDNSQKRGTSSAKASNRSKKSKGKAIENSSRSNERVADNIISTVRALQSNHNPVEEVEVLSKDGYRSAKGKSVDGIHEQAVEQSGQNCSSSSNDESKQNVNAVGGGKKQRKKTSKFHRIRLGDGSAAALSDLKNSDPDPEPDPLQNSLNISNEMGALPVQGVWKKGTSKKLFL